ncbi:hypothetical protein pb186bvf_014003 [Paramecium bursaria]
MINVFIPHFNKILIIDKWIYSSKKFRQIRSLNSNQQSKQPEPE